MNKLSWSPLVCIKDADTCQLLAWKSAIQTKNVPHHYNKAQLFLWLEMVSVSSYVALFIFITTWKLFGQCLKTSWFPPHKLQGILLVPKAIKRRSAVHWHILLCNQFQLKTASNHSPTSGRIHIFSKVCACLKVFFTPPEFSPINTVIELPHWTTTPRPFGGDGFELINWFGPV